MTAFLSLFLFLLSVLWITQSKRITFAKVATETNQTDLNDMLFFIPLNFPFYRQTVNALYDSSSNFILINQKELSNDQLSESIGDQPTNLLTTFGSFNGKIYSEAIAIQYMRETTQANPFVLANSINFNRKEESDYSIFGLGRHFGNFNLNKYSNQTLIEQLFDNQIIPYSNFGHRYLNQRSPHFFFGEYFDESDYYSCPSQNEKIMGDSWNCRLQIVKFSSESVITITMRDGIFATGMNRMILPKQDFDRLVEELTKLTSCVVIDTQPLKMKCLSESIFNEFPNITFTFDSFNLYLNRTDYMIPVTSNGKGEDNDNGYEYISPIEYSDTNDYWLLGLPLLKKYDMLFDYETNTVVFLNLIKEDFISISNPKFKVALIAFSLSIALFIIYIYYIIYLRKKTKKKRDNVPLLHKQKEKKDKNGTINQIRRSPKSNVV